MKQQDLFGGGGPTPAEPEWVRREQRDQEAQRAKPPPPPPAPAPPVPQPAWRKEPTLPTAQSAPRGEKVLSVGQLTRAIKDHLEPQFLRVLVKGEVTGYRAPNVRGHLYFALKDDFASIDVKVWATTAARLKFQLKDGLSVIVEGGLDLYEQSGRYSLIVQRIEPTGVGAQALAYAQLKAKLMAEGLFGPNRKQPRRGLPLLPRRVGVVTSISGAALKDFLKVLHRRHPRLGALVADARVQGEGAADEVARAIRRLSRQDVDVIVVTRGGGSAEDLWTFNEEVVARAIFACPVPVVSAVGHEVDTTLADHVADYRAPTPSAAAEAVAPVLADLQLNLSTTRARLRKAVERRILEGHHQLKGIAAGLGDPRRALTKQRLRLSDLAEQLRSGFDKKNRDRKNQLKALNAKLQALRPQAQLQATRKTLQQLSARLQAATGQAIRRDRARLGGFRDRLHQASPRPAARAARAELNAIRARLPVLLNGAIAQRKARLGGLTGQLEAMSPLKVLARGYAIALKADGHAIRSSDEVSAGEQLKVRLGRGEVDATVTKTYTGVRDDDKTEG